MALMYSASRGNSESSGEPVHAAGCTAVPRGFAEHLMASSSINTTRFGTHEAHCVSRSHLRSFRSRGLCMSFTHFSVHQRWSQTKAKCEVQAPKAICTRGHKLCSIMLLHTATCTRPLNSTNNICRKSSKKGRGSPVSLRIELRSTRTPFMSRITRSGPACGLLFRTSGAENGPTMALHSPARTRALCAARCALYAVRCARGGGGGVRAAPGRGEERRLSQNG
mmetsp:Transcript_64797/g.182811  ORF Transcript_64797/g.182811 Transcript_64797/m.182811 type:complete len:223 (+) Transcript_64797:638-1306(+)